MNTKKAIQEMIKSQKEYMMRKTQLQMAIKEYKEREQKKFKNKSIINILHEPKSFDKEF